MIFSKRMLNQVLAGSKTETRRPLKGHETECRYKPGRDYAVQPNRGTPAIARITVLGVDLQRVGDITYDSARREGFKTRDDFWAYWTELYGQCDHDQQVWAIAFRLVDDPLRLLHRDSSHGYTHDDRQALDEEPEAIDERAQEEITIASRARFAEHQKRDRAEEMARRDARRVGAKIRQAAIQIARNGGDPTAFLADLERKLAEAGSEGQKAA